MRECKLHNIWCATALLALAACAAQDGPHAEIRLDLEASEPVAAYEEVAGLALGEPLGVAVDMSGNMYVADGVPGRVVCWLSSGDQSLEFQQPAQQPGFYPSDIDLSGFFVYALDPVERTLLRFDNRGAYRDILIKFDEAVPGRRVTPLGLDVDEQGRIVVTDVQNHRIILFDAYLAVELAFGSYGTHPGQFDAPEGVAFTRDGSILVTDSGNGRLQLFDTGGTFLRFIPSSGESNPLLKPRRAVIDNTGNVYVADPEAGRVFVFDEDGALIRSIVPAGVSDFKPTDVDVDGSGLLYVTDAANSSLFVFR